MGHLLLKSNLIMDKQNYNYKSMYSQSTYVSNSVMSNQHSDIHVVM